jgi:uncharacterized protein (DUF4415 family)
MGRGEWAETSYENPYGGMTPGVKIHLDALREQLDQGKSRSQIIAENVPEYARTILEREPYAFLRIALHHDLVDQLRATGSLDAFTAPKD